MAEENTTKASLNGLPRQLISIGIIDETQATEAAEAAAKNKSNFLTELVSSSEVSAKNVAQHLGNDFGLPIFDLNSIDPESLPSAHLNPELLTKYNALPIAVRGTRLFVAISDPTNNDAIEKYKFTSGFSVETIEEGVDDSDEGGVDETPVVRFVNKVLLDAIKRGASDIHVEPYEKIFRIRYRVDGILEEVVNPPLAMAGRLTARLKVMSRMDIRAIDFRVNTCPTLFGEKTVLRILDPSSATLGIDALGYEPEQKKLYMDALANPYGMILVTGPTGSGKTVSLYTGLNILNDPATNISTAEDPAEINLAGINQVNVNPKAGLTFAEALKSFLRQDPDVIMVGEIRDLETGSIAIKAAQTGHLVLSTLHTNDAPQTLSRLINMGIPPFNIATAVSLIIAQRLARRLCESCKAPDELPKEVLISEGFKEEDIDGMEIFKPVGCSKCNSGYKGRVGIYQVMGISEEIGRIIMGGGNAIDIADQARKENIPDLRESALMKIQQGILSLEEANRVTKD